jgi:hypothetical protein
MALSASTVWETRASGASDNNGGGFVAGSGGTDRSQQNGAQVAVGGGVVTSSITTTVVTFTGGTYTVLAGDVGNTVQFISGTNVTAGFYQITTVSAGLNGTWTLDRTPLTSGTTTNAVANMGGALATLGKVAPVAVASNKIYCTGAFTTTASIAFAQSSTPSAATTWAMRVIGYGAARNDSGHATLTLTANTGITVVNLSGIGIWVENLDVDCGSFATSTAFSVGNHCAVRNCKAANFATKGISLLNATTACTDCEVTGGLTGALGIDVAAAVSDSVTRCYVHDNACPGINLANNTGCAFNLVTNNTGASSDGIRFTGTGNQILNNTCHGNAGDGIKGSGANMLGNLVKNNLVTNNGGFGITMTSGSWPSDFAYDGNAYGGGASANTSGTRNHMNSDATGAGQVNPYLNPKDVTLSASPYVGPTSGGTANFALNNTAGGGADCRAVGAPSAFPGLATTTSYVDMGAVQGRTSNTSPSAGGSPAIIMATG